MPKNAQVTVKAQKSPATKTAVKPAVKAMGQTVPKVAPKANATVQKKVAVKVASTSKPKAADPVKLVKSKTIVKAATKDIKPPKQKLIRDSFTFPEAEYLLLVGMKKRLLAMGIDAKKGELVRAGIALLSGLADAPLTKALAATEKLKAGRPAK